jgi:hypothetical protein
MSANASTADLTPSPLVDEYRRNRTVGGAMIARDGMGVHPNWRDG